MCIWAAASGGYGPTTYRSYLSKQRHRASCDADGDTSLPSLQSGNKGLPVQSPASAQCDTNRSPCPDRRPRAKSWCGRGCGGTSSAVLVGGPALDRLTDFDGGNSIFCWSEIVSTSMRVFPASRGHRAQSGPNLIRWNVRSPRVLELWRFRIRLVYQTRLMVDPVCDRSMIRRFTFNLASQTPRAF